VRRVDGRWLHPEASSVCRHGSSRRRRGRPSTSATLQRAATRCSATSVFPTASATRRAASARSETPSPAFRRRRAPTTIPERRRHVHDFVIALPVTAPNRRRMTSCKAERFGRRRGASRSSRKLIVLTREDEQPMIAKTAFAAPRSPARSPSPWRSLPPPRRAPLPPSRAPTSATAWRSPARTIAPPAPERPAPAPRPSTTTRPLEIRRQGHVRKYDDPEGPRHAAGDVRPALASLSYAAPPNAGGAVFVRRSERGGEPPIRVSRAKGPRRLAPALH